MRFNIPLQRGIWQQQALPWQQEASWMFRMQLEDQVKERKGEQHGQVIYHECVWCGPVAYWLQLLSPLAVSVVAAARSVSDQLGVVAWGRFDGPTRLVGLSDQLSIEEGNTALVDSRRVIQLLCNMCQMGDFLQELLQTQGRVGWSYHASCVCTSGSQSIVFGIFCTGLCEWCLQTKVATEST